ncbi:Agamous-like MADS-box protein [Sesamum angolense]|uniref:Agamous-like MADS-box protein n=1 Tax=Sesamum angolense TaxID=2727404 RepID=A0AAE1T8H9_9LAMI|nr:Agamous-like MADS-box protein [Sesamum angolense]
MGRGKIEIKKIENANSRQVTFSKRRAGLFKKAYELSVLCEADVAVIIFSNTGKVFDFSSSSMKKILTRYKKCLDLTQGPAAEQKPEKQQPKEVDVLKEEIEKLKLKQLRFLGKDFTGMSLQDLRALEQQLNEGLLCIKERKEQLLMQQLAQSRVQVEELRTLFPSTSYASPLCMEFHSTVKKSNPVEGSRSPETACNGRLDNEDSETTLHLGPPSGICRKRKTPDGETHSSTS